MPVVLTAVISSLGLMGLSHERGQMDSAPSRLFWKFLENSIVCTGLHEVTCPGLWLSHVICLLSLSSALSTQQ